MSTKTPVPAGIAVLCVCFPVTGYNSNGGHFCLFLIFFEAVLEKILFDVKRYVKNSLCMTERGFSRDNKSGFTGSCIPAI